MDSFSFYVSIWINYTRKKCIVLSIIDFWLSIYLNNKFVFRLYNPVKLMKRILYVLGPLVFLLLLVLAFCIGSSDNFATIQRQFEWRHYTESKIWHSAVTQALWSSQIAGGFLISSGDTIYFSTNVQWWVYNYVINQLFWLTSKWTLKVNARCI